MEFVSLLAKHGLSGRQDQWGMGSDEYLRVQFARQVIKDPQQCGQNHPLPPWMQVGFQFVYQDYQLPFRSAAEKFSAKTVLVPRPDYHVCETDHPSNTRRFMNDGHIAIRMGDGGNFLMRYKR